MTERTDDVIARLAAAYLSREGRATLDRATFLSASRSLFESLGWTVLIWSLKPEGAVLDITLVPEGCDEAAMRFFRSLAKKPVRLRDLPSVAECVRTGRGHFREDTPQTAERIHLVTGGDAEEAHETAQAMKKLGWHRRACAPVIVNDRVEEVVIAHGPDLEERDFAAVQLFAAQLAATEMLRELSNGMIEQQRLAALGQLSTLVAHEVRNPLAVIFQACRQLRRIAGKVAGAEQMLDILDEEAGRLSRLVDDLVRFASPTEPHIQKVDLTEVMRWCLLGMSNDPERSSDGVETHIARDASLVQADPLLLRHALTYLLTHASDHAEPEGEVWITSERLGDGVRIRVHHTGPPLSEEQARRVFEPFFTATAKASGLGLAAVHRLIEDQGGRVKLDREEDHCAFSIYLPAA